MKYNQILYVAYDNGSRIPGTRLAPYHIDKVISDIGINSKCINLFNNNYLEANKYISCSKEYLKKNTLVIGGDHSITYFTTKNLETENSLLVIFDAHIDYYPNQNKSVKNWNFIEKLIKENIFCDILIIGVRNKYLIKKTNTIRVISSTDINNDFINQQLTILSLKDRYTNIYISIDVDVLNTEIMSGVSYPEEGGISLNDLINLLNIFNNNFFIKYIDLVEFNPMIENEKSIKNIITILKNIFEWN